MGRVRGTGWVLWVALAGACAQAAPQEDERGTRGAAVELARLRAALREPACEASDAVWENPRPEDNLPCPDVAAGGARWSGAPVLSDKQLPAGLRGFCRYRPAEPATSAGGSITPLRPFSPSLRPRKGVRVASRSAIPQTADSARALTPKDMANLHAALRARFGEDAPAPEPNCANVAPLNAAGEAALRDLGREQLWQMAGRMAGGVSVAARTRVAIVDTAAQPYTSPTEDNYGHGRLMGRIVEDLTCSDAGTCAAEIRNYLAMPRLDAHTVDTARGGTFGTRTELALALWRALQDWTRDLATRGRPAHLVLNLSLGWDPDWLGGLGYDPASMPPASKLVYALLARARCLGAATVAAAGNRSDKGSDGPTVPGAWEALRAPDKCEPYLGARYDEDTLAQQNLRRDAETYAPLVYAAEGVDQRDLPLSTSRHGATPRLVAYGLSAVTRDTRAPHTATLAGTSIAAAVVSAAAAYVWAVDPSRSVEGAMDAVYASGVTLHQGGAPQAPELCLEDLGPCAQYHVSRVSVCASVAQALCSGAACPLLKGCDTVPEGQGAGLVALDVADFAAAGIGASLPATTCGGSCAADLARPSFSYAPWVGPQPGSEGCAGVCAYDSLARTAYIWVDSSLASNPQYITLSDGSAYALPTGYSQYLVTLPGSGVADGATFSMTYGAGPGSYTADQPLWVY